MTSLRLETGPEAEHILTQTLTRDPDKGVRVAAMRSVAKRATSPAVARAVAQAAQHDEAKRVRYEGVLLLGQWAPKSPFLSGTLEAIAKSDAEPTIRSVAAAALTKVPAQIAAAKKNP